MRYNLAQYDQKIVDFYEFMANLKVQRYRQYT